MPPRTAPLLMAAGLAFTLGLVAGLLLQLPGSGPPPAPPGHLSSRGRTLLAALGPETQLDSPGHHTAIRRHRSAEGDHSIHKTSDEGPHFFNTPPQPRRRPAHNLQAAQYDQGGAERARTAVLSIMVDVRKPGRDDTEVQGEPEDIQDHSPLAPQPDATPLTVGCLWAPEVALQAPGGWDAAAVTAWRREAEGTVAGVGPGCGRDQNRRVLLQGGGAACARARLNTDQLQGELYSFHLSRLLGVHAVPPAVLARPDPRAPQWAGVRVQLTGAQWPPSRPVVLTPWVPDLGPAVLPPQLRGEGTLTPASLRAAHHTPTEIAQLVQWSDLVVFDYLTANVDRVVNNMFNSQWNAGSLTAPTHNLGRVPGTGQLVLYDNESGLFHSYRLLDKYAGYHEALLARVCVFRAETRRAVRRLHAAGSVGAELRAAVVQEEPLAALLPAMAARYAALLHQRLAQLSQHMDACERHHST